MFAAAQMICQESIANILAIQIYAHLLNSSHTDAENKNNAHVLHKISIQNETMMEK